MKILPLLKFHKGYTLVEILISVAIITVVFGVILTSATGIQKNGRDTQRKSDIRNIQGALQQYYADQSFYPDDNANTPLDLSAGNPTGTLTSSTGNGTGYPPAGSMKTYLTSIPKDPINVYRYCYRAFVSIADQTTDCANTATGSKCNYYKLYARLETVSSPINICKIGFSNYTLLVTPQ